MSGLHNGGAPVQHPAGSGSGMGVPLLLLDMLDELALELPPAPVVSPSSSPHDSDMPSRASEAITKDARIITR